MLDSMSDELQHQHEDIKTSRQMLVHLQELFDEQSHTAKYQVTKRLFKAQMHDGQLIQDHYLMMIKNLEELEKHGVKLDQDLQTDIILQSLTDAYGQFIMNYHIHKLQNTLAELMNMLVTAELSMKDSKDLVLVVEQTSSKKILLERKKSP